MKHFCNQRVPSGSKARTSSPNEITSPAKVPSGSKARTSSPNESTSPAKVPSGSKARTSSPNESTSPAKVPSSSKARTSSPNESTSPAKVPSGSKARTSSPNESTSPAKVPSCSKARTSSPNKSTSPAKVPSSSKARTSPKRQPENVTIQSDVEKITVTASGAQSTTRGGAIPKTSTQQILKNREIRKDYSNEQASYSERRSEQVDLHMKKYGRINRWIPLDFIPPSSDTSEDVPKEPMRIFLPPHKSEAKANAPHETFTSSVETPENVDNTRLEAEKEMGTVSEAQSSVAHGGARPKIRAEETSKSKKSRKERRNFKDALDVLDYISSKGMSNLEPLLQEAEKKCSKTYPRSDWIDTTEDAETNEIVTLEELHKILEEEFEKREKEKVKTDPWVPIATSSSENSPEDGLIDAAAAFVEQPPHVESESSSSGQQAVDVKRFEIVDLPIQEMSADALFDALHEIKLQHGPEPWLELLKIFFRTGRFHASGELETVRRRMYDSDVMRQFYELYWTHYREMRHRAIDTGYSEEPEYNFRRLRRITSRIEKMTLAMLWLDVNERLIETHEDQMQRMEEDMAQRGARGHFPLPGGDSPSESSSSSDLVEQEESRSDGDLVEQERSRSSSDSVEQEESGRSSSNSGDLSAQKYSKRPSISYQQLHERVKHDERKNKPKPIDRFRRKVTGSRPPSRLDSSDDSSVEGRFTPPHFNQICKENSLLKELMLRKGRRSSSHENISHNDPNSGCAMIPLHHLPSDTVKRSSSTNSLLSRDSSESVSVEATPKTASSSSPGSGGDLLSKHTRSEETDSSGDSKHFAAVDLEPEHSFANVSPLPLDPEETELEKVLDDMFVDMVHFVREKEDPEKQ
ncbi:hypothetical protein NPIL_643021 [Nephila pilipes]|uniref:Uncharacterized protein n=1 Tax=Nephila pilipes TaxID=299642 RepID=A0A8X6UQ87_NEPPI|nr:hypothetical protein NPIL_643021 [Nephila pilipes]